MTRRLALEALAFAAMNAAMWAAVYVATGLSPIRAIMEIFR